MNNQKLVSAIRRTGRFRRSGRSRFRRNVWRGQKRIVRRAMKSMTEVKYCGATNTITGDPAGTVVADLGGLVNDIPIVISQGPGKVANRIGNLIQYKHLTFRCLLTLKVSATAVSLPQPSWFVRVILFQKRIPVTQLNQVLDIGGTNIAGELITAGVMAAPTINQNVRVLNDETFVLNSGSSTSSHQYGGASPSSVAFVWRHKINNKVAFRAADQNSPTDPHDQYGIVAFVRGIETLNDSTDAGKVGMRIFAWTKISYYDM